jgi:hypothetical protein
MQQEYRTVLRTFTACTTLILLSRIMAQAVSCRPLTAEDRVRARVGPCAICGEESGNGTGFSPNSSVSPCQYHSNVAIHTFISCGRGEEQARWWLQFRDIVSLYRHEHEHCYCRVLSVNTTVI